MNSNPIILEISSDEDDGVWDESKDDDQIDWLSELLDSAESINDDVVFMGEVSGSSLNQKQSNKKLDMKKPAVVRDDSDDDCLILDKDPDNPVAVENDTDNGSDELLIVSQKGQIACRDYPHARDQCARFPFKTSPHEKYCDLCHCYVCDSRAPCKYWGTGVSKTDHCRATDKEEIWKIQRKCFKQRATLSLKKVTEMTSSNSLPAFQKSPTQPLGNGSFTSASVSSTVNTICPSLSNFSVPGIINRRNTNSMRLAPVLMGRKGRVHHVSSRSQLLPGGGTSTNNIARRERFRGNVPLSPHPNTKFKRVATGIAAFLNTRYAYSESRHYDFHSQKSQPNRINQPSLKLQDGVDHSQRCQNLSQSNPTMNSNSTDALYSSQPNNNNQQNLYPLQNPVSNIINPDSQDFNSSWYNETSSVNPFSMAEGSQIPGLQQTTVLPLPVDSLDPFYGCSHEISGNPSGQSEFDNWFDSLGNQSVFGVASNDTVPSQTDFVSSPAVLMDDRDFVFDFES